MTKETGECLGVIENTMKRRALDKPSNPLSSETKSRMETPTAYDHLSSAAPGTSHLHVHKRHHLRSQTPEQNRAFGRCG